MYLAIFAYIEHLFDMIKPKKLFYMAIDGVAPRAKMNQQRARRFRSALDAERGRAKAIEQGIPLPSTDPFDSNAITPGTEFMEKLTVQLKYFVHKKVSTDSSWQNIEIILSGHEVPGEGEHKIMEHIRVAKAQPGYSSNMRHCMYGLDADLIMLGLLSHDPHFALLREEVTFGRQRKQSKELQDQNFYLLHLSIVREYLELEFAGIEKEMKFDYDFERVLDDFILINFFIGNDFLPEVPSLVINDGALPIVFDTYKTYLRESDGYMNNGGIINFQNMRVWLQAMSKFEFKLFESGAVDVEWFNEEIEDVSLKGKEKSAQKLILTREQKELVRQAKAFILSSNSSRKPDSDEEDGATFTFSKELSEDDVIFLRALCEKVYLRVVLDKDVPTLVLDSDGIPDDESEEEQRQRLSNAQSVLRRYEKAEVVMKESERKHKEEVYSEKFLKWKSQYYKEKFKVQPGEESDELIRDVAENYLEGLQWVLLYYYRGVASWGWYYRYHYAPKISDIQVGLDRKITFNVGTPFHPFEQLMAVLPDRSKALVPQPFRSLMTDDLSPIKDFYPRNFELDMNGKKNDWEAIVKIPFVDEKRLLSAINSKEPQLSAEEKARNGFGTNIQFNFNPQVDTVYPSSFPGLLPDLEHCHCIETVVYLPAMETLQYVDGLCPGAKLGVNSLAGFPSLKTLPFTFKIELAEVVVFQHPSRNESIIITLENKYKDLESSTVSRQLLNRPVYINWPYLREAKVVAITDELCSYEMKGNALSTIPHQNVDQWQREANGFKRTFSRKGVKIGQVPILVHLAPLKGMKRTPEGALVKEYGEDHVTLPLQTLVESVQNEDERYIERPPLPVEEEYPIGSKAVYLGPSAYGNPVTVTGHGSNTVHVEVLKLSKGEISLGHIIEKREKQHLRFMPSYRVAKEIGISTYYLSRITTKYLVEINGKTYDVGLNIRSEAKKLKVLGYSQKSLQGWEYSALTTTLIKQYLQAFPDVHRALMNYDAKPIPDISRLLNLEPKDGLKKLDGVRAWLKEKVLNNDNIQLVTFETEGLSKGSVMNLEREIAKITSQPISVTKETYKNTPREALLAPQNAFYQLKSQHFNVGDRVVNVLDYGKVNLFSRGTVISVNSMVSKVTLDVLFDIEFDSGTTLNGRCGTKRGLTVEAGSVLNLSVKQLVLHSKKSQEQKGSANKAPQQQRQATSAPQNAWKNGSTPVKAAPKAAPKILQRQGQAPAAKLKPVKVAPNPRPVPVLASAPQAQTASGVPAASPASHSQSAPVAPTGQPAPKQKKGKSIQVSAETDNNEEMRQNLLSLIKGVDNTSISDDKAATGEKGADKKSTEKKGKSKQAKNFQKNQQNVIDAVYAQYGGGIPPHGYDAGAFPPAPPGAMQFMPGAMPVPGGGMFPPPFNGMAFPPAPPFMPFIPGQEFQQGGPPQGVPPQGFNPMPPQQQQQNGNGFDEQGSAQLMAALNGTQSQQVPTGPKRGGGQKARGGTRGRGAPRGRGRGGRGGKGTQGQGDNSSAPPPPSST